MSPTAHFFRYICRHYLTWFGVLTVGLLSIVLLFDTLELMRRAANKPEATFPIVLRMGLLKLPEVGQQIFPFIVLFAAMYTFWKLTRSQELVVARAVGVSAWQFLMPVLLCSLLIGAVKITIVNPVSAAMLSRYEHLDNRLLRGRTSVFGLSDDGLWLRQTQGGAQQLIHARGVTPGSFTLRDVLVILYERDGTLAGRIDADSAQLNDGFWLIRDAWLHRSEGTQECLAEYRLPTDLSREGILESFASPQTLSFWELPEFIETLEKTGLSSVRHRLHYQALLAQPVLFCAMVLFAAAFSLRHTRRGGSLGLVASGIATGLAVFVLSDVTIAFGVTQTVPVILAAWAPAGIALLLGIAALLHLEDG